MFHSNGMNKKGANFNKSMFVAVQTIKYDYIWVKHVYIGRNHIRTNIILIYK